MKDWKNNFKRFMSLYGELFEACFVVGSTVYTNEFSDTSDIDLFVIIKDKFMWEKVVKTFSFDSKLYDETQRAYDLDEIQYFSLKFMFEDIPYSMDLCYLEFLHNALLDIQRTKPILYFKGCNEKQEKSFNRIFREKKLNVNKINIVNQHSVNVSLPLFYLGDYFYFGILTDKFLTGVNCVKDNNNYIELITKFKRTAAKKFITQNSSSPEEMIIALARSYRFGEDYSEILKKEFEQFIENE